MRNSDHGTGGSRFSALWGTGSTGGDRRGGSFGRARALATQIAALALALPVTAAANNGMGDGSDYCTSSDCTATTEETTSEDTTTTTEEDAGWYDAAWYDAAWYDTAETDAAWYD